MNKVETIKTLVKKLNDASAAYYNSGIIAFCSCTQS